MTVHLQHADGTIRRLIILDPSYATCTGHNHAVNSLLLDEARRRGIESYVFAHASIPASSNVVPTFRTTAYGYCPQDSIEALHHSHAIARAFAEDLAAHVQPRLAPADILFAHTLHNPLLHGFSAWVASLSAPGDRCIRIGLNLPPDFRQRRQDIALWNAHQYAFAFQLLTAVAPATRFYAETRELESQFATLHAQPISHRRLPLRVITENGRDSKPRSADRLIYFIPGEIRAEKGHEFLINGVLQLAARRPQWLQRLRFRFTSIGMPDSVSVFLTQHPDLFEVLPETTISVERYWQLMAEADVVGCTYDPHDYGTRASGIFLESLALGKPVLVSHRTSVAAEVASAADAYGVAVEFGDIDSLAAGLERLVDTYDTLARGATAASKRVQSELSAEGFFDWLLTP